MFSRIIFRSVLIVLLLCAVPCAKAEAGPSRIGLAWVVEQVRRNNPEYRAAEADVEAAKAQTVASRSWPDPQIGVEFWDIPRPGLDLSDSDSKWLDFSQEIPFPTKTVLQSEIAGHALLLKEVQADKTLQDRIFMAKQAYWDLYTAAESLKAVAGAERALDQLISDSRDRIRQGLGGRMEQFMQPMARMERTNLKNQGLALDQERADARARLARLTATDAVENLLDPEDGAEGELSDSEVAALQERALKASPGIQEAQHHLLHMRARQSLARSGWLPDLMLQYSLIDNTGGPQNGMAMVKVNLPFIWFWRQASEVKAAHGELESSEAMLRSAEDETAADVKSEVAMLSAARGQWRNDQSEALPDADRALSLALTGYGAGSLDVSDALEAVKASLMERLESVALEAQIGRSIAGLEALADLGASGQGHETMEMNHEN